MGMASKAWTEDTARPLTPKEAAFVEGWFLHAGNTTAAAKHAGYSGKHLNKRGYEASCRANVQQAIAAQQATHREAHAVTLERVRAATAEIAFNTVLREDVRLKALDMLMKHFGGYVERLEHTGKDGKPLAPPAVTVRLVRPHDDGG